MGISAGGSKGGPKSEMNVTPLVDVVLVLLVIFMVTMPVMMRNITIEIPRELEDDEISMEDTQISVKGMVDGTVEISDGVTKTIFRHGEVGAELKHRLRNVTSDKNVFVDFEDDVPWGQAMSVLDTIKGAGTKRKDETRELVKISLTKPTPTPASAPAP